MDDSVIGGGLVVMSYSILNPLADDFGYALAYAY